MAELFDSYASDFTQLTESITQKLEQDAASQTGEVRKATLRRVEMEVEEAEEIVSQMEIEIASFPNSIKSTYSVKLRGYKAELDRLSSSLRKSMQQTSSNRLATNESTGFNEDLESGRSSFDAQAQRQRLLQGTNTLEDGSRRLQDSHRIALETEDLGADILRDLRGQREQIENSRDTVSSNGIFVMLRTCLSHTTFVLIPAAPLG
jgi:vesicle transport through interaction with t-SNAREs protein 1